MTFSGRSELDALLETVLPSGWLEAYRAGDEETIAVLRRGADRRQLVIDLGKQGWVAPHWPTEHGGRALDVSEAAKIADYLDDRGIPRTPPGAGFTLAAPAIQAFASAETKRRFLPTIASGEERWCQLFSEPGAGSDLASLSMSAVRDGDEWIVNGQKVWTTLGHQAEFAMTLVRTDPSATKHKGITYLGVDLRSPGVEIRPLVNIARQVEFNEIFLTDVRVPDLYRISPLGEGWRATQTTLGAERHTLSSSRKKRSAPSILGGKTIDQVIELAVKLGVTADLVMRQRIASEWSKQRVLALTIERAKARRSAGPEGSITKIATAAWNQSLQLLAMDILGSRATAWEHDSELGASTFVDQMLRTRANSIEGGTSEIQRNIVGEKVLGLPREPDPHRGAPWSDIPRS